MLSFTSNIKNITVTIFKVRFLTFILILIIRMLVYNFKINIFDFVIITDESDFSNIFIVLVNFIYKVGDLNL